MVDDQPRDIGFSQQATKGVGATRDIARSASDDQTRPMCVADHFSLELYVRIAPDTGGSPSGTTWTPERRRRVDRQIPAGPGAPCMYNV